VLQGDAKRDYMRDYMRKRRAGQPTRKPTPQWQPTPGMIIDVRHWFSLQLNRRWDLRGIGSRVVTGLEPYHADGAPNQASWNEALQRYRTLRAEQRAERKRKRAERDQPEPPAPKRCWFCDQPVTVRRPLFVSGAACICARCTKLAAAAFAKHRKRKP
jgi:hypothetical protein